MSKTKDELIRLKEEREAFVKKTHDKLAENEIRMQEIKNELSVVNDKYQKLKEEEWNVWENIRNFRQELYIDKSRLAQVDKMFEEARSNDADWDYDNDKQ